MHKHSTLNLPSNRQIPCKILLLLGWVLGLMFGIVFAFDPDPSFLSLMRSAVSSSVSIVGLLVVLALPYLLTAIAVYISRPELLIPLAFFKALSFSVCAFTVDQAFLSAGWLLRSLLLFSDLTSLPILMWLWLRCMEGNRNRIFRDLMICVILTAIVGALDYCLVSPYLATLIR